MADGLTVPFALAAGLAGAVDTTRIIVTAGLAEIAAGSIAMGLGGDLAAKSDIVRRRRTMLRSVNGMSSCTMHATDGDSGSVDEFVFDDEPWTMAQYHWSCDETS
jgi:hypothetical protein